MAGRSNVEELVGEVKAKMNIVEEEEEEGLVIEEDDGEAEELDLRWCLVGSFVTERNIKFPVMQVTMGDLWKPVRGMFCKELAQNRYLFQFFHEMDIKRVMEGGPWSFDNAMLVWKRLEEGENPRSVEFTESEFWVQLHDVCDDMRKWKVCEAVGNYLGRYVASDPKNFDGDKGKEFLRVRRVAIDFRRPLKRRMKMKMAGGEWVEFNSNMNGYHPFVLFVVLLVMGSGPARFSIIIRLWRRTSCFVLGCVRRRRR